MPRTRSLARIALAVTLILGAAACEPPRGSPGPTRAPSGSGDPTTVPAASAAVESQVVAGPYAEFVPDPGLLAAARAEGGVATIGLPRTRCNFAEVIDTFKERTGLGVSELLPDASDVQQLEAVEAGRDDPGGNAPDVIEVDLSTVADARQGDLIQPYKVAAWDGIPASAKDPEGCWYGDYYGVQSFEVTTDVVTVLPTDWADLLEAGYDAQVALSGDPQQSSTAMYAVYAAALANGGTADDATKGLEFFRDLNSAGNFLPVIANTATVAARETPIRLAWTYDALSDRDDLEGTATVDVIVPTAGRVAGVRVLAISKDAQHPNAARLWMEFLLSDEGQSLRASGYCHPIRFAELIASKRIPAEQLARLPDVTGAIFPTLAQADAAETLIRAKWQDVVGADIVCSLDCE